MTTSLYPGQTWGWDGIDQREVAIQTKSDAGFENGWSTAGKSWMDIFHLFPTDWLFDCYVVETSAAITEQGGKALNCKEFICWLGLWLLIATCSGW